MNKDQNNQTKWFLFDAKDKILGRLCTEIVDTLRGKKETSFIKNIVGGNKVVVINTDQIKVTGKKEEAKRYYRYSGFHGGLKEKSLGTMRQEDSCRIIFLAVKGMLPKNKLQEKFLANLKLYKNADHKHNNIKFQ
jgi:large subunit ribosomal protein L13